jgi:hypothetical protein
MQVIYYTADIYFPLLVIKGEVILKKISWEGRKKSLCSVKGIGKLLISILSQRYCNPLSTTNN